MPNHIQTLINNMTLILIKIKRYYPITQMQSSTPDAFLSFSQRASPQETTEVLSSMLGLFIELKSSFERSLPERIDAAPPMLQHNAASLFALHKTETSPEDTVDEELLISASELYSCFNNIILPNVTRANWGVCMPRLLSIVQTFETTLGALSDEVERFEIHSSAFSLARHLECLKENYKTNYKESKRKLYFHSPFTSDSFLNRIKEIDFLMEISLHPDCDDDMRFAVMKVLERKFSFSKGRVTEIDSRDQLKKLLISGLSHATMYIIQDECFSKVTDFCHSKNIIPPDELQIYINTVRRGSQPETMGFLPRRAPQRRAGCC